MSRFLTVIALVLMLPLVAPAADMRMMNPMMMSMPKTDLTTDQLLAKASYILGYSWSRNMASKLGDQVDMKELDRGIKEGFAQKPPSMDEKEMRTVMMAFQGYLVEQTKRAAKDNLAKAEAFLAENKKKEGVKVTDSGLQYIVQKEGEGPKPKETDKVTVHYHGTLLDGTVFDSSVNRGKPTSFPLNKVIEGWKEGVQLMSVGGKYKFFLHPKLAYKERDMGKIKPNSMLTFEVELIGIEESKPTPSLSFPAQKTNPKLVFPTKKKP